MGHYTRYSLEYLVIIGCDKDISRCVYDYVIKNEDLKNALIDHKRFIWVGYDSDMEAMSKNFPGILLILEAKEEDGITWEECYLNGTIAEFEELRVNWSWRNA